MYFMNDIQKLYFVNQIGYIVSRAIYTRELVNNGFEGHFAGYVIFYGHFC